MSALENRPELWRDKLPIPDPQGHKYDRGHTAILGADVFTGATRLAAEACSRIGSGLVTVLSGSQADLYRVTLPPDIMVTGAPLTTLKRPAVVLAGPGGCSDAQAGSLIEASPEVGLVLDADAVRLWPKCTGQDIVLTPHAGEFVRYFDEGKGEPTQKAAAAALRSGAIVVLKGPITYIAAPDGRIVENTHASPYLAKAGTGDLLAGLIAGLMAQGMPAFEAACAAVWIHGEAAQQIGPGLVPQDMFSRIGGIMDDLLA